MQIFILWASYFYLLVLMGHLASWCRRSMSAIPAKASRSWKAVVVFFETSVQSSSPVLNTGKPVGRAFFLLHNWSALFNNFPPDILLSYFSFGCYANRRELAFVVSGACKQHICSYWFSITLYRLHKCQFRLTCVKGGKYQYAGCASQINQAVPLP